MRISINRTDLTVLALVLVTLIALAFAPGTAFGHDGNTSAQPQNVPSAIEGIVTKRTADTFTVRNAGDTETVVVLTDTTRVRWSAKGSQFFYDTAGSTDKTLKRYEGHYHDLLNDLDKETVMADIDDWIAARISVIRTKSVAV